MNIDLQFWNISETRKVGCLTSNFFYLYLSIEISIGLIVLLKREGRGGRLRSVETHSVNSVLGTYD